MIAGGVDRRDRGSLSGLLSNHSSQSSKCIKATATLRVFRPSQCEFPLTLPSRGDRHACGPARSEMGVVSCNPFRTYSGLTNKSETCIRGHRSLKCQHFDRLMKKVRRPGRPLTKCHCMAQRCGCAEQWGVMSKAPFGKLGSSYDGAESHQSGTFQTQSLSPSEAIDHIASRETPQAARLSPSPGGLKRKKTKPKPNPLRISFLINHVNDSTSKAEARRVSSVEIVTGEAGAIRRSC